MSSYRRFISYMHQYPNGKKGNNCGFVKIEVKSNICSLWFQLKKVPSADTVSISFFIREKDTVTLVPIWEGSCPNGTFQQHLTTDSLHLFNTNYSFGQCGGILLRQENRVICGSCWDTVGAVPVDLAVTKAGVKPSIHTESSIQHQNNRPKSGSDYESNYTPKQNNTSKPNYKSKPENDSMSNYNSKSDNGFKSANNIILTSTPNRNNAEISSETVNNTDIETITQITPDICIETTPESASDICIKKNPESASDIPIETKPKDTSDISSDTASNTSSVKKEEEQKNQPTFEELWNSMQKKYPPLDPFEEGGIVEGIKISPTDLPYLQCLPFNLGANRFLLHGYKNYKHLLLGRMEGQNRYILGVPGVFDSQEQFMAKMFGFPCFKPIRSCMKPVGQFGYWFRCIHS